MRKFIFLTFPNFPYCMATQKILFNNINNTNICHCRCLFSKFSMNMLREPQAMHLFAQRKFINGLQQLISIVDNRDNVESNPGYIEKANNRDASLYGLQYRESKIRQRLMNVKYLPNTSADTKLCDSLLSDLDRTNLQPLRTIFGFA